MAVTAARGAVNSAVGTDSRLALQLQPMPRAAIRLVGFPQGFRVSRGQDAGGHDGVRDADVVGPAGEFRVMLRLGHTVN